MPTAGMELCSVSGCLRYRTRTFQKSKSPERLPKGSCYTFRHMKRTHVKAIAVNSRLVMSARVITFVALGLIGGLLFTAGLPAQSSGLDAARSLQNAFRQVSADVLPVVVQVNTVNVVQRQTVNPFEFFFRFPILPMEIRQGKARSTARKVWVRGLSCSVGETWSTS